MKAFLLTILFILMFGLYSCATLDETPAKYSTFNDFDNYVKKTGGWGWNNADKSKVFQEVRNSLKDSFESELLKYIKNDLTRTYWCGIFLGYQENLNKNDVKLKLKIYETGIAVKTFPKSENSKLQNAVARQITMMIVAALLYKKTGNTKRAKELKRDVGRVFAKYPVYEGAFPAMTEEDSKIYESL